MGKAKFEIRQVEQTVEKVKAADDWRKNPLSLVFGSPEEATEWQKAHAVPLLKEIMAEAKVLPQAETEQQRIERMTAAELAREIDCLRPSAPAELAWRDTGVLAAVAHAQALQKQYDEAKQREKNAQRQAEQWRDAHPVRAKMGLATGDLVEMTKLVDLVAQRHEKIRTRGRSR